MLRATNTSTMSATAWRAAGRPPYIASSRVTWSRTPQCNSKSNEITRAPGRFAMLIPYILSAASFDDGSSAASSRATNPPSETPMVVDACGPSLDSATRRLFIAPRPASDATKHTATSKKIKVYAVFHHPAAGSLPLSRNSCPLESTCGWWPMASWPVGGGNSGVSYGYCAS